MVVRVPGYCSLLSLPTFVDNDRSVLVEETEEGGSSWTSLEPDEKRGRGVASLNETLKRTYIILYTSTIVANYNYYAN